MSLTNYQKRLVRRRVREMLLQSAERIIDGDPHSDEAPFDADLEYDGRRRFERAVADYLRELAGRIVR
ncbi:MAG: hypothetical protein GY715_05795 [Planctomycetes bacterium]|nr:hypothetical protein [Planctomycetota bacterium]